MEEGFWWAEAHQIGTGGHGSEGQWAIQGPG